MQSNNSCSQIIQMLYLSSPEIYISKVVLQITTTLNGIIFKKKNFLTDFNGAIIFCTIRKQEWFLIIIMAGNMIETTCKMLAT